MEFEGDWIPEGSEPTKELGAKTLKEKGAINIEQAKLRLEHLKWCCLKSNGQEIF